MARLHTLVPIVACAAWALVAPAAVGQSQVDRYAPSYAPAPGGPLPAQGYPTTDSPAASGQLSYNVPPPVQQAGPRPESRIRPIPGGQIMARVGSEVILAGEVMPRIDEMLERNKAEVPEEQFEQVRQMLAARELKQFIETKMLYVDARRKIPEENYPQLEEKLAQQFDEVFLPMMMKDAKATTRQELEAQLARYGSSIAQQKRIFSERTLAAQWLRQQIRFDREISHDEMLAYYREHQSEYEFEAKARWEEIMVRFDRFPNKAEAFRAIASLGNQVVQGAPFAQVAKAGSQGVTSEDGGAWDWTSRGSLVSQVLNHAIFTLPVGHLSQIVESEQGLHIVRVVERRDAGRVPFEEAQVEIRKKIQKDDVERQKEAYMAGVRSRVPVWTVFDSSPTQAASAAPGANHGPKY